MGIMKKVALAAAGTAVVGMVAASGIYLYQSGKYRDVYFPGTVVNGIDVSQKTPEEAKTLIAAGVDGYQLLIQERGGVTETVTKEEIGLHTEFDGSLEQILSSQNPYSWGLQYWKENTHEITTMLAYDEAAFESKVSQLNCLNPEWMEPPADAYVSNYIPGEGYQIIPETEGTEVDPDIVRKGISDAVLSLQQELSLEALGAYKRAAVTRENEELAAEAERWNQYMNVEITYQFGDVTEVLNGDQIHTWLREEEDGSVVLDEEAAAEYVKGLAKKYDTAYKPKTLKTTYGPTITIDKGNYGWRINQKAEKAAILEIIRSGEGQTREPIYSQTAASRGEHDYGNTYVEINLSAQHLYYYKDGNLVIESDFVSGNMSRGWGTPGGAYPLTYKQRNATLRGEGYATPVSYWMPFNGGIGMHDANWRGSFGGNIYKTNGSHGCINLPPAVAKTIYENISSGMPVLCYYLDGTGGSGTSTPKRQTETKAAPVETAAPTQPAVPETPPETAAPMETPADIPTVIPAESTAVPAETVPETAAPAPTAPETAAPQPAGPGEPGATVSNPDNENGPGVR